MNRGRNYHSSTSFLDLLFNTVLVYVFLFFMAFLLITPEQKQSDIKTKAEFIVTLTWDDESVDDVDLWMEDPLGDTLYFRSTDVNFMHLDRDDLGFANDSITMPDGRVVSVSRNQEIASIRGFIPGEWILNIHMYNKRDFTDAKHNKNGIKPTNVKIKLEKINPSVKTIVYKTYVMRKHWEEITVVRFTMSANGDIISVSDLPKKLLFDSPIANDYTAPSVPLIDDVWE